MWMLERGLERWIDNPTVARSIRRRLFPDEAGVSERQVRPRLNRTEAREYVTDVLHTIQGEQWYNMAPLVLFLKDIYYSRLCVGSRDDVIGGWVEDNALMKAAIIDGGYSDLLKSCPVCMELIRSERHDLVFVFSCTRHGVCMECLNGMVCNMLKRCSAAAIVNEPLVCLKLRCPICNEAVTDLDTVAVPWWPIDDGRDILRQSRGADERMHGIFVNLSAQGHNDEFEVGNLLYVRELPHIFDVASLLDN